MEEALKRAYELGFQYERDKGNCAQSILAAIHETIGFENDTVFETAFKAAAGLCGGGGDMRNGSCGAFAGGIMAIGLKYGREHQDFVHGEKAKSLFSHILCRELVRKLDEKFMQEYNGVTCCDVQKEILGRCYDGWDPKEREAFEKAGAHIDKCPSVVGNAARWTAEILLKAANERNYLLSEKAYVKLRKGLQHL